MALAVKADLQDMLSSWSEPFGAQFAGSNAQHIELSLVESIVCHSSSISIFQPCLSSISEAPLDLCWHLYASINCTDPGAFAKDSASGRTCT